MKHWNIIFFVFGLVLFVACTDDERRNNTCGRVNLNLKADHEIVDITTRSLEESDIPNVADFSVAISKDEQVVNQWKKLSDYSQDDTTFPVGNYILTASYGNINEEGFNLPYYEGKTDFVIKGGSTTDVEATCVLANTKISIAYTDDFRNYFKTYSTSIKSEEGNEVIFVSDETRAAYVKSGKVTVKVTFVKVNGGLGATTIEVATIDKALSQHHYHILMDVDAGKAELSIMFDRVTEEKPITLDISDKALNIKAPYFTLTGFEKTDNDRNQWDGNLIETPKLSALLTSLGGFKSCMLKTTSATLLSKGWSEEGIDLGNIDQETEATITNLGLKLIGFGANKDQMAVIDFTGVVSHLDITDINSLHLFYLQATSMYGKQSEEYVLNITTPKNFMLLPTAPVKMKSTEVTIPVKLKIGNPQDIKLYYKYYGVMTLINSTTITPVSGKEGYYNIHARNIDMGFVAKDFQAEYNGAKSAVVSVAVIIPKYSVSLEPVNMWAYTAEMTIVPEKKEDLADILSAIEPYASLDGNSWVKVDAKKMDIDALTGKITITGLNQGTLYYLKTTCDDGGAFSDVINRTTENVLQLADFTQGWTPFFSGTINKGGKYYHKGFWQDNRFDTTVLEVFDIKNSWTTVNEKTVPISPKSKNTWYMVSSAMRENGGILLRNVAWSDGLGDPPSGGGGLSADKFTDLTPPTHEHSSAGKLFLGDYSYDHSNDKEAYNEGIGFTSRPVKLKGKYTYTADKDEGGKVIVTVVNREGGQELLLGEGNKILRPASALTDFVVELNYKVTNKKATHLKVMFTSSSNASDSQTNEDQNIETTDDKSSAISTGSELYIENDIKLEYK